jgi:hypothetical protein
MVVALLLWLFPMTVAHRIIPRTKFDDTLSVPAFEAARVGCALLGLWFLLSYAPSLLGFLIRALLAPSSASFFAELELDTKVDLAVYLLEVVVAFVLIVRAASFASLVSGASMRSKSGEF